MSDYLTRMKQEKLNTINRTGKTFREYEVYCPYCAHEYNDIWETGLTPNSEWTDLECYSCEKTFNVMAEVVFNTERIEND